MSERILYSFDICRGVIVCHYIFSLGADEYSCYGIESVSEVASRRLFVILDKQAFHAYNAFLRAIRTIDSPEWGCSSAGRASDWQSEGRGFEPHHLHHNFVKAHAPRDYKAPIVACALFCVN